MHITWHGLSCVKIQVKDTILLINPYQDSVGVAMPKLKADIVASTDINNDQCNNFKRIQGNPMEIDNPGEYENKGIFIYGVTHNSNKSMFVIESGGITVSHPGLINQELTDKQLEFFKGIDVLLLPLTCEGAKTCSQIVSQVEPRVIIPIQYKTPKMKPQLDTIDMFAKEMGITGMTAEKKIIIKAKDLPVDETKVMILSPV